MGSFGKNLRRQRELRGISLDEIAQHTKIGTRILAAIEDDRFELLPGGVFNRSFVLHYARYVGLDEAQVAAEFDLMVGRPPELDIQQVASQRESHPAEPAAAVRARPHTKWAVATGALSLVLLLAAGFVLRASLQDSMRQDSMRQDAMRQDSRRQDAMRQDATRGESSRDPSRPVASQPQPAAATMAAGASASSEEQPSALRPAQPAGAAALPAASNHEPHPRLRLQVDTMDASWVIAHADGHKLWEAQMGARETRTVDAESNISLRVGNAGAVVLTLNGETQPPLGRKGEAKTVKFTPNDLKQQ